MKLAISGLFGKSGLTVSPEGITGAQPMRKRSNIPVAIMAETLNIVTVPVYYFQITSEIVSAVQGQPPSSLALAGGLVAPVSRRGAPGRAWARVPQRLIPSGALTLAHIGTRLKAGGCETA